jgi:hypothetical protein
MKEPGYASISLGDTFRNMVRKGKLSGEKETEIRKSRHPLQEMTIN